MIVIVTTSLSTEGANTLVLVQRSGDIAQGEEAIPMTDNAADESL